MAKRHSPTSEGSDADDSQTGFEEAVLSKKQRLVDFTPLTLTHVNSVADLHEKALTVAVYKLSETVRHKNKMITQKEKEIERLRIKQITDENTSCCINRHWNNLDEQMRMIVQRGANPDDVDKLFDEMSNGDSTSQFLEEVVQMDEEGRENAYDKRVQSSVRLLRQVLNQSITKAELFRSFSVKMERFLEPSTSSSITREEALNELVHTNSLVSDENSRLTMEVSKQQQRLSAMALQLKETKDAMQRAETKNAELQQENDEMRHDLDKANRKVEKLDYRLYNLMKEYENRPAEAPSTEIVPKQNGIVSSNGSNNSAELENLRVDYEAQVELAANRLTEIKELNEKIKKYAEDLERAKFQASEAQDEALQNSKEFTELKMYFSAAADELSKAREDYKTVVLERELIRSEMLKAVDRIEGEDKEKIRTLLDDRTRLSTENARVQAEIVELKKILDQKTKEEKPVVTEANIKQLCESFEAQIAQLKSENTRVKRRWNESVKKSMGTQKSHTAELQRLENGIIIDMDKDEPLVDSSLVFNLDEDTDDVNVLRQRLTLMRSKLEAFSMPPEQRDIIECIAEDKANRIENARLQRQLNWLKKVHKEKFDSNLKKSFQNLLDAKKLEIDQLNKEKSELLAADQAVNQEMESIGQALDELQTSNKQLLLQLKALEDERIKMMGDRISSNQILSKHQEEKNILEAQLQSLKRQLTSVQSEHQASKEALHLAKETISSKAAENSKVYKSHEELRKKVMEISNELAGRRTSNEKLSEQVKELQETVVSKAQQHEINIQKNKRLEEDNNILRKRVERARKTEKLGSTDAVLSEEVRNLKEQLTCPSCKVNRKDAILTKCFHVFCMTCLKTRYDTRQRKCPKCNANFGANDFQRAYIC